MAGKGMKRFKGVKGLIIIIVLICLILGYYFYLSNRTLPNEPAGETEDVSAVQDVLLRDMEKNYPPTPKEVIKYYCEITKCFYNEELSETELNDLAARARELYDAELVQNQTQEQYISDLQDDIKHFKDNDLTVSTYRTSDSLDVEEFSQDGYECARLYCAFTLRQGTSLVSTEEVFILRKDETGHWKIFGWELTS